ncbi:lysM and putative peptidoglycan-binding domain-containing protein 2-like isoform X1 [Lytechinus variegatus]|uniref:lysM and putative peptidoglycan-binding domain-containing protein 2-like isoform X1 n=1 Tax=Lytechinus variegatus TaxID=7654 RepID=UPI001BB1BADE|nr:lysM and putative peptidoglycan-binding domain-containing protein 2-like isoform X1 [Lytechinus variegatus]
MASVALKSETTRLGLANKNYGRSYGATMKSQQETFIQHDIQPGETLQGISIKYAVPVEQIKRANKLFNNDIFMRKSLSIPVGDQPLPANVLENATATANGSPARRGPSTAKRRDGSSEDEEDNGGKVEEADRDVTMDFFNRIDRQVREKKHNLKKIEKNSSIGEIEAMTPNIQSAPSPSQSYSRISESGKAAGESYQLSAVTVATEGNSKLVETTPPVEVGGTSSPLLGGRSKRKMKSADRSWPV